MLPQASRCFVPRDVGSFCSLCYCCSLYQAWHSAITQLRASAAGICALNARLKAVPKCMQPRACLRAFAQLGSKPREAVACTCHYLLHDHARVLHDLVLYNQHVC